MNRIIQKASFNRLNTLSCSQNICIFAPKLKYPKYFIYQKTFTMAQPRPISNRWLGG